MVQSILVFKVLLGEIIIDSTPRSQSTLQILDFIFIIQCFQIKLLQSNGSILLIPSDGFLIECLLSTHETSQLFQFHSQSIDLFTRHDDSLDYAMSSGVATTSKVTHTLLTLHLCNSFPITLSCSPTMCNGILSVIDLTDMPIILVHILLLLILHFLLTLGDC